MVCIPFSSAQVLFQIYVHSHPDSAYRLSAWNCHPHCWPSRLMPKTHVMQSLVNQVRGREPSTESHAISYSMRFR